MSASSRERLLRRVEGGEALGDAELEELARHARAEPGPEARLALAHALLNAQRDRDARPLLEALGRDFPLDHRVLLARARGEAGLERWHEAEALLRKAAALRGSDPEVEKALALLALRRGEVRAAEAGIERVLAGDPLDDEARLVREELRAADVALPAATDDELGRVLAAALDAAGLRHRRVGEDFLVRLPRGAVTRLSLPGLREALRRDPAGVASAAGALAAELAARHVGMPGREALLATVLPVLRAPSFAAAAAGAAHREGPAGLLVYYVIDDPDLVRHVPEEALREAGVSLELLDRAALANLEARPAPVRAVERGPEGLAAAAAPTGVWAVFAGDGHDGARLLTSSQRARLRAAAGAGELSVALPAREIALVGEPGAPLEDVARAVASEGGIEGTFRLRGDRLL